MTNLKRVVYVLSVLSVLLLIAVIVLAAILGVNNAKDKDTSPQPIEKDTICTTKACISAANMILQNINQSADPCEDFNQFACGSFIKNERIPDDQSKYDVFDILRNRLAFAVADLLNEPNNNDDIDATINAKNLYRSCMNESTMEENGEESLLKWINDVFQGWPMLDNNNWNENTFSPIDTLITSRKYSLRQVVDVYISTDPKDPTKSVLKARQPGWLFNKQYYNDSKYNDVIVAYKEYAFQFAKFLGSKHTDNEIKQQVEEMFSMEKTLGLLTLTEDQKRNTTYKNTTIKQLAIDIPDFEWKTFIIDGMFKDNENVTMDENEIILVDDWDYLVNATKAYKQFATDKKRDLKNLLLWVFIKDRHNSLPKRYRDARQDFDKIYRGTSTVQARSITCANFVLDRMDYAAGRLYVSRYFNNDAKDAATEMINYVLSQFKLILEKTQWMDSASREKALQKADYIESKIGYPDFLFNKTEMHDRYKDYVFVEDDFFKNTVTHLKVSVENDFKSLRNERNRKNWITGPAVVNAFYSSSLNQIAFPAGILQAPFYDAQNPNYLNYGGIGSVIGHEITHGFDDRGRLYDKDGIYFPDDATGLWTNETIQNYKQKAKCIIDQYSGYVAKQVNLNLNGFQTQGENIADNGGIKESFYAYQKWVADHKPEPLLPGLNYNQNQLFFINYAQVWCAKYRDQALIQRILTGVHSPNEFRILGPTSNFEEFAKAFSCKSNTNNNPSNKCSVW